MSLAYLAVIVTITSGQPPEVSAIPQALWAKQECSDWKTHMESKGPATMDATGKAILSRLYVCQITDTDDIKQLVEDAPK